MGWSPHLEVTKKPAVLIGLIGEVPSVMVNHIQEGLEEEGIPCEIQQLESETLVDAASRLAKASRINVGIAISMVEKGVVLHHRDLPVSSPLIHQGNDQMTGRALQILGRNAARLVKGDPLILEARTEG